MSLGVLIDEVVGRVQISAGRPELAYDRGMIAYEALKDLCSLVMTMIEAYASFGSDNLRLR